MDSEQRVDASQIQMPDNQVADELTRMLVGWEDDVRALRRDTYHEVEHPPAAGPRIDAVRRAIAHFSSRAQMERVDRPLFGPREHPDAAVELRYSFVEAGVSELVRIVKEVTPPGREQSLALTNLEQAGLWALCAIGRDKTSGGTG